MLIEFVQVRLAQKESLSIAISKPGALLGLGALLDRQFRMAPLAFFFFWPGEWGYLADLLFWGRKLMLWASKLPRQQWRLLWTHFFRLTPCRTRFRTLWLRYGLSEFNISVIDLLWTRFLCAVYSIMHLHSLLHHFARRIDTFSFQFGTSQLISSPSY